MIKYIATIFTFFGVWFVASLLNGLLSGICIMLFNEEMGGGAETLPLSLLFSFLFSIPLVGIVWLVTTIAQVCGRKGHSLFQTILGATLICAFAGAIFFILTLGNEFNEAKYAVGFCVIFSALTAVLFFRNQFKTDE